MESYTCQKCGKTMNSSNFFTYKNGEKTEMCKKCLTMHVDNYDESTYLWLMEKMDIPYIPEEWIVLRDKAFAKDPYKMNGMSVFGKYLAKMRLIQWKNYGWADSEVLRAKSEERRKMAQAEMERTEALIKEQYENGEITEAHYKTMMNTESQYKNLSFGGPSPVGANMPANFYNESQFLPEEEIPDATSELTSEDKLYLAMKWGRLYKPDEWLALEKNYTEMTNSFDIQDADTINTLMMLCKINLKMNQAIDIGDVDGALKFSRMYDSLRKSAKFTAAQNKEGKSDFVDSVGELVAMCEREGFIPRYATDIPQDKVDITLKDMNNYVRKLVTQDLGFGQQIEDAIKKLQIQKERLEEDDEYTFDDEDSNPILADQDYEDYYDEIASQKEKDTIILQGEGRYGIS